MPRIRLAYQDPEGRKNNGFPTYAWQLVPEGLLTRRQLRNAGLRPNGHGPVAQLLWGPRNKNTGKPARFAWLYDTAKAAPKRPMTDGRQRAVEAMLRARRTCPKCGFLAPYCLPISLGSICLDCAEAEGLI